VRGAAAVTDKLNAVHDLNPVRLDPAFADAQSRLLADEAW
jgi:hypothetical protein